MRRILSICRNDAHFVKSHSIIFISLDHPTVVHSKLKAKKYSRLFLHFEGLFFYIEIEKENQSMKLSKDAAFIALIE